MLELSILDLLYLVLTFFLVIVGTLLTLVLLRLLKILAVGVEISDYYWQLKKLMTYYSRVPFVLKEKIFDTITFGSDSSEKKKTSESIEKTTEK